MLLLKERLYLSARSPMSPPENRLPYALRSRAPATSGYWRSFSLLAEASLVPVDACTSINPHNDLVVDADAAVPSFHGRHQDSRYRPPRYGPKPSRFERCHDAPGPVTRLRTAGFPATRCRHRVAAIGLRPVANPSPRGSEQLPAARRLVSYRLDTRRTLRKTGGSAVFQRRPNLGRLHRSARSARRQQLRSDAGETRTPHHGSRATRMLRGSDTITGGEYLPLRRGSIEAELRAAWRCSLRSASMRPLGGIVRSGRSDIEATSGAEPCLHGFGGPTCSRFSPGRLTTRLTRSERAETHPSHERRAARRGPTTNHRTTWARQSQVGHDRQTPQRASEVSNGDETPPLLCCLTRNQLRLQHVRSPPEADPRPPRRAWRTTDPVTHTVGGEETDKLEEHHDGGALGRAEHNPLRSPTSSNHRVALLAAHRGGQPSGPPGDRGHPSPLREVRDPSNTEMLGGPLFRPGHEETHRKPSTETHPNESSTSSSLTNPSCSRGTAPLGTHRSGRQARTRGNRGHPLPPREGRDPPTPRCRAGHSRSGSRRDHRRTDDGDILERVEHALPAHRRVAQPREHSPGHPPKWTAVKRSRQPRSPLTLARGLCSLRHRDAGRVAFSFGSRRDPSKNRRKDPSRSRDGVDHRSHALTQPTAAAKLASHDRNRGALRRGYQTGVLHHCRASSRVARDPKIASRCQPTDRSPVTTTPRHPPG